MQTASKGLNVSGVSGLVALQAIAKWVRRAPKIWADYLPISTASQCQPTPKGHLCVRLALPASAGQCKPTKKVQMFWRWVSQLTLLANANSPNRAKCLRVFGWVCTTAQCKRGLPGTKGLGRNSPVSTACQCKQPKMVIACGPVQTGAHWHESFGLKLAN